MLQEKQFVADIRLSNTHVHVTTHYRHTLLGIICFKSLSLPTSMAIHTLSSKPTCAWADDSTTIHLICLYPVLVFSLYFLVPVGLDPKQRLMDLVSISVSVRACMRACVRVCVCNHISDMYGPILFLFDTKTTHDGIH